jgi:hypothetical protein
MEDKFYLTVSIVAVVVLVVALSYVGILLYTTKPTAVFPETVSKCPDYWEIDGSTGKCKVPPGTSNTVNVGDMDWNGPSNRQLNTGNGAKGAEIASLIDNSTYTSPAYSLLDVTDGNWNNLAIAGVNTGSALCNKARWARTRGIIWQGVSNTNAC